MKKALKKIGMMLPMLAVGFVCGGLVGAYAAHAETQGFPGGMLGAVAMLFVGFLLGVYLQVAAHEAGHLVCGLLSGYRFCSYRLGSFMLIRESGKLRLRRLKIAGTAGQCLLAPPPWSEDLPVILYNLGGCLANLLMSALCLLLWLALRHHWLGGLPLIAALTGVGMALTNGIPMRVGGVDNDGRNARHLGKDRDGKRAFWQQMKVCEAQAQGLRLHQMPEAWFEGSEEHRDNPLVASIAVLGCNRLMDQLDLEGARAAMETLLENPGGMAGLHRSLLQCDLMYCRLMAGDIPGAKALMGKDLQTFLKAMKTFPSVLRTQYAMALLAEGDESKAQKLRKDFEKYGASYPYPAEVAAERELLELAERRAGAAR